jgi:hypothetical protein
MRATVPVKATPAIAIWPYLIPRPPIAVIAAYGFVVIDADPDANVAVVAISPAGDHAPGR